MGGACIPAAFLPQERRDVISHSRIDSSPSVQPLCESASSAPQLVTARLSNVGNEVILMSVK